MRTTMLVAAVVSLSGLSASAQDSLSEQAGNDPTSIPRAASNGGPRRWQVRSGRLLDLRDAPSMEAPVTATLDAGTVLANRGCERIGEHVWCSVRTLRGEYRGHASADMLQPAIGPDGAVPSGIDDSAPRARANDFDAQGLVPCAQERGQVMGECTASVARGDGGDATVVIGFPNGFRRTLTFVHGEFVAADATMSGTGSDNDWNENGGLHTIRVDDQRYALPADLIFGP